MAARQNWPLLLRHQAFALYLESGYSMAQIGRTMNMTPQQVKALSKKDDWKSRYEARVRDARENYDANASKMIEAATPRLTHGKIKQAAIHEELVTLEMQKRIKALKSERPGHTELKVAKLSEISTSFARGVTAESRLLDPKKGNDAGAGAKGNTFIGSQWIVGVQALGKTKPAVGGLPAASKPAIEATATEFIEEI